jgi:hypothetical protein
MSGLITFMRKSSSAASGCWDVASAAKGLPSVAAAAAAWRASVVRHDADSLLTLNRASCWRLGRSAAGEASAAAAGGASAAAAASLSKVQVPVQQSRRAQQMLRHVVAGGTGKEPSQF